MTGTPEITRPIHFVTHFHMHDHVHATLTFLCLNLATVAWCLGEDVGSRWGTESQERAYYQLENLPIPAGLVIEAGAFEWLPDGRLAVGTRRGDIYFVEGLEGARPEPSFHLFATGLDEIFGLVWQAQEQALYVTQSYELTRIQDRSGDGRADRFESLSDAWGYGNYHEYAFGSKFDPEGNLYVALGLSNSYHSRALFRGWIFKVTPSGESIPFASGLRSPGGIGFNEHGSLFYIESQGPWNSSCSLKAVTKGSFHGHPVSFNWYPYAPDLGPAPLEPTPGGRILTEKETVRELVPYAVIFPYIRMGRSITGFVINHSEGAFGPYDNQMFLGDFTQSILMRATTEQVNGVWQGACYPFREGLSTGILNIQFTPAGNLICGGIVQGWPVRGIKPFALERVRWTGKIPFEMQQVQITPEGFRIRFTQPADRQSLKDPEHYQIDTFTHIYHAGYGGPEVDATHPAVREVRLSADGMEATLQLETLSLGHVHTITLQDITAADGTPLLHNVAHYTVNAIPRRDSSP